MNRPYNKIYYFVEMVVYNVLSNGVGFERGILYSRSTKFHLTYEPPRRQNLRPNCFSQRALQRKHNPYSSFNFCWTHITTHLQSNPKQQVCHDQKACLYQANSQPKSKMLTDNSFTQTNLHQSHLRRKLQTTISQDTTSYKPPNLPNSLSKRTRKENRHT